MALALYDRVKETTTVAGTGTATLLGATTGFQSFAVVGNANTTYYCIADQGGANWEVGIGTYTASGTTLARTTVLSSSNAGALVVFTAGIKDVFVTYPSEKGVWLDASGNAIGLGTPAAFVGTNITGTASGLTAGNVTTNANLTGGVTSVGNAATVVTNANLTGAVTSVGNASSLGSFTSLQLATALTNETGTGSAVFSDNASLLNPTYTGTLTGSTGVLNIGSGQVYKDASGNVGIGTSSPACRLNVVSGTNSGIQVYDGTVNTLIYNIGSNTSVIGTNTNHPLALYTNNAERMRIDSSGNVGIGTSSPSSYGRLAVMTPTATYGYFGIANSSGGGGGLQMAQYYGTTKISYIDSILSNGTPGSETAGLAFATASVGTLSEKMRIDSAGNVGIGTSSPGEFLHIYKPSGDVAFRIQSSFGNCYVVNRASGAMDLLNAMNGAMTFSTNNTERMRIDSSGNVGIGTSSPGARLDVRTTLSTQATFTRTGQTAVCTLFQSTADTYLSATNSGANLILATQDTERMRISSTGIVTMNAYGAGAATFSASGVISSVSDETWKIKDGVPNNPDEMIQKLKPGYWFYNAEKSPIFGTDRQLGFYAQNVNEAIGIEAAPVPEDGKPWGYYDRSVLAVAVMSLQKALTTIESLTERLTALENK